MENTECIVCFENMNHQTFWVTGHNENNQLVPYCWICTQDMLSNHHKRWMQSLKKVDCASALRRLIKNGPPMTIADAIPELQQPLQFGTLICDQEETSGKLIGSHKTEDERQDYWNELKVMLGIFEEQEKHEKQQSDEKPHKKQKLKN